MRARLVETLRAAAGRVYWASPHALAQARGKATILMYHRVLPAADLSSAYVQPGMYVTAETFERHLRFLRSYFEILPFADLLRRWRDGDWDDSARYCALTFDDGWLDNYRYAAPLLRACAIPATIFLPTDLVGADRPLWPDRLGRLLRRRGRGTPAEWDREIERAKGLADSERDELIASLATASGDEPPRRTLMNWDEVDALSRQGISFGSHSATHANLTRVSGAALERELRGPLDALRARAIDAIPVLAYPNGDYTPEVAAAARAAGYEAAVTTRPGVESRRPADLFRLRRVGVHDDVTRSVPLLALHIARQARAGAGRGAS
jgi:peptidoglycan/xylan/chitin deacetylase (PgdA/CDA1 family)